MGQKDLTAKELESRPDVFADIINALVYRGKQVILPQTLQAAPTETLYAGRLDKEDDKGLKMEEAEKTYDMLRSQYNDVSKYEMTGSEGQENPSGQTIKIQYILENESGENYRLLLRKAGYEGAVYRNEYEEKQIYPVVILVLYWGDKKWKPHTSLHKLFRKHFTDGEVMEYVDNIKLHIYPMAHLPAEIRQRFKSDMRIVVDYLAEGKAYQPTGQSIKHIGPVMRLLYALTGEKELESILTGMQDKQEEGEELIMKEYYTTFFANQCRQEGRQQGREEGREEGMKQGIDKGREEGMKQGIDKLSNLISQLIEKGREEDMQRSLKDKEYQKQLFKEFGL